MRHHLRGRDEQVLVEPCFHEVFGYPITSTPPGCVEAFFALGCFWGAEKLFCNIDGVRLTAVGYMGGVTPNPTYEEVCTGGTDHAETVRVCFDPTTVSYEQLVIAFFENHNPTQGDRQGADVGTQYRSMIFATPEQHDIAERTLAAAQPRFTQAGYGEITTEIADVNTPFFYAENYHQQYLIKNPQGYCPIHATGVECRPSAN